MSNLSSEALTAIIGEHSRDHTDGGISLSGCSGCAMVAHLEALERERDADRKSLMNVLAQIETQNGELAAMAKEREADRAAINGYVDAARSVSPTFDAKASASTRWSKRFSELEARHAAAIQRAQVVEKGEV